MSIASCIYCSEEFEADRGEGDHVIPAASGKFEGDIRFRRVCPGCNTEIGRAEQQLIRSAPAGMMREVAGVKSARGHRGQTSGPAMGVRGPKSIAEVNGAPLLVKRKGPGSEDISMPDQLILQFENEETEHIELHQGMKAPKLRERVIRLAKDRSYTMRFNIDEKRTPHWLPIIEEAWPGVRIQQTDPIEAGIHRVPVRHRFEVNEHTFRALAKIGFHYFLSHTRRGLVGSEPCFAEIREFIRHGGDWRPFFTQTSPIRMPFGPVPGKGVYAPSVWCHLLAVFEATTDLRVHVQLFLGPKFLGTVWVVKLGRGQGIELPESVGVHGHMYVYSNRQPAEGFAGRVEELPIGHKYLPSAFSAPPW